MKNHRNKSVFYLTIGAEIKVLLYVIDTYLFPIRLLLAFTFPGAGLDAGNSLHTYMNISARNLLRG